jgi:hypothetical protein
MNMSKINPEEIVIHCLDTDANGKLEEYNRRVMEFNNTFQNYSEERHMQLKHMRAMEHAEEEIRERERADARAKEDAQSKASAKSRADAHAKAETEAKANAKSRADAEAKAKAEAEAKAKANAKSRADANTRKKEEKRAEDIDMSSVPEKYKKVGILPLKDVIQKKFEDGPVTDEFLIFYFDMLGANKALITSKDNEEIKNHVTKMFRKQTLIWHPDKIKPEQLSQLPDGTKYIFGKIKTAEENIFKYYGINAKGGGLFHQKKTKVSRKRENKNKTRRRAHRK